MARETQADKLKKIDAIRETFFSSLDDLSDMLVLWDKERLWAIDKSNDEELDKRRKFFDLLKQVKENIRKDLDKAYTHLSEEEYRFYLNEMDKADKFSQWDWFLYTLKPKDYKLVKEWFDCLIEKQ